MRFRRSVARATCPSGTPPGDREARLPVIMGISRFDPALVAALRKARYIAALTGAGISAESGIATFRDARDGLWARFDPRELATPGGFARNPKWVWDWYAWHGHAAHVHERP